MQTGLVCRRLILFSFTVNPSKTEYISVLIIISVVEISPPFVHAHKVFVFQNDVAVEVRL